MSKSETLAALHEPFVKKFTFSDGTVKLSCSVKGCAYGRGQYKSTSKGNQQTTKHTDSDLPELPIVEDDEWDEVGRLAAQLALDARPSGPQAGEEEPELDTVVEVKDKDGAVTAVSKSALDYSDGQYDF